MPIFVYRFLSQDGGIGDLKEVSATYPIYHEPDCTQQVLMLMEYMHTYEECVSDLAIALM